SSELSAADLELFDPRPQGGPSDQRAAERFPGRASAVFTRVNDAEPPRPARACVVNLSLNGAALHCDTALESGELLNLDLADASGEVIPVPLACVVRVSPLPGDGGWLFGCNFLGELSEEQLRALT